MQPGSKQWHSKARELLGDEPKTCNIPALKSDDGNWVITAKGKADLLATTMAAKHKLAPAQNNKFSKLTPSIDPQWTLPIPIDNDAFRGCRP